MSDKNTFLGELKRPITFSKKLPTPPTLLTGSPEKAAQYEKEVSQYFTNLGSHLLAERLRKIPLLLEHFEISTGDRNSALLMLVLVLAEIAVPGFKFKESTPVGRTQKWTPLLLMKLYFDVEEYIEKKNTADRKTTASDACLVLAKKEEWKKILSAKRDGNDGKKTLENKYSEAKNSPLVQTIIKIKKDFGKDQFDEIMQPLKSIDSEDFKKVSRKF